MFLVIYGVLPKSLLVFEISFVFLGIFWAFININSIVVVWALAPEGKTGAYTGIYYFFSQLAAILSPIFMGFTFDLAQSSMGVNKYQLMIPYLFVCMFIALIFLTRVKRGEIKLNPEEINRL